MRLAYLHERVSLAHSSRIEHMIPPIWAANVLSRVTVALWLLSTLAGM
jgi:hypothetical protein